MEAITFSFMPAVILTPRDPAESTGLKNKGGQMDRVKKVKILPINKKNLLMLCVC